jgi:serine/threonine protein kinase
MQEDVESTAGVRPGDVLAGKYRIERILGIGGMGVVVAAMHLQLDEKVALKFLLPAMLRNREVVSRFAREARAAVKIKSEHVARVSDVGTLENGAPYMVMEFLEGGDLAAWLEQRGPLPVDQAVDFVLQACVGVASAHGIGIVHRDLKPANLFCIRGNDGQFIIKVLDFGISKITNVSASDAGGSMTHTASVMGSPYYMSPEQMQSAREVDERTDIWALGVIVYELLTGTTPFVGESFAEIAIKVATGTPPPVRSYRPDVPAGLESVILKSLDKDKTRRYSNVAELALALAEFGSKRSRASIERVVGIIQASGLSNSALALPPTPNVPPPPAPPATRVSRSGATGGAPSDSQGTIAPSANTAAEWAGRSRSTKVFAIVVGVAAVSLAVALGLLTLRGRTPTRDSNVGPAPASRLAEAAAPVVLEAEKPSEPPSVAPAVTPSQNAASLPTSLATTKRERAEVKPPPGSKPAPAASQKPVVAPQAVPAGTGDRPDCNPNYYFDAQGQKRFKHECFGK